jgi:hypothetical protein
MRRTARSVDDNCNQRRAQCPALCLVSLMRVGQAKLEGCIQSKLQGIEALLDKTK